MGVGFHLRPKGAPSAWNFRWRPAAGDDDETFWFILTTK
jgi:hypothetical protein